MSEDMKNAFAAAEVRLKSVRQGLLDHMDAGAGKNEIVRNIAQGDLERWFDALEVVSGLVRSGAQHAENSQPCNDPGEDLYQAERAFISAHNAEEREL